MNLSKVFRTIRYLRQTVHGEYGRGLRSYFNFAYYSLFRINTYYVYCRDIDATTPAVQDDACLKFAKPSLDQLEKLRCGKDLPREFFCDKIHNATTCYVATSDGRIAYIHWAYFSGDHSRFLKVGRQTAEINYVMTLPDFRGQQISTRMFNYTANDLGKFGYTKLAAVVHNENIASIKAFTRAGFCQTDEIVSLGPFNRKICI